MQGEQRTKYLLLQGCGPDDVRTSDYQDTASCSEPERGRKVSFKGEALGTPLPTYQWQKLADDGTTWEDVSKANKTTLYFSKVYKAHAGKYRIKATNAEAQSLRTRSTLSSTTNPS